MATHEQSTREIFGSSVFLWDFGTEWDIEICAELLRFESRQSGKPKVVSCRLGLLDRSSHHDQ